ncbi:MAG TPA: hypothetical protein VLX68_01225 [Chitinivibrionales bacterium]|nr:hypothetical protein [Chitinivibrionales bacterium]
MPMTVKHKLYADGTESGIIHPTDLLSDNDVPTPSPGKRIVGEIVVEIMDDNRSISVADLLCEIADQIRSGRRFS